MAFRIQNNIASLNAQRNLGVSEANMNKSLERLSSGYRINSAKDDAAGLAISSSFRANIASVKVAQRNISEANALLQVAEGAMSQIGDILTRMKELATQAASANVGQDISKVSSEYNTLVEEIDRIVESTKYAGTKLIDGSFTAGNKTTSWNNVANIYNVNVANAASAEYTVTYCASDKSLTVENNTTNVSEAVTLSDGAKSYTFSALGISFYTTSAATAASLGAELDAADLTVTQGDTAAFQIGYEKDSNSQINVALSDVKSSTLGVARGDLAESSKAFDALEKIDKAISTLANARAAVGAYQNRLGYAAANLDTTLENFTAADSVIRDVDMASEMTNFTKNQILVQAGVAMLSQANQAPQLILSLFR